jgi:hypothetical protein
VVGGEADDDKNENDDGALVVDCGASVIAGTAGAGTEEFITSNESKS